MNRTLIALIIAMFLANIMILSRIRDDINSKKGELKQLKQEIAQWEYVNGNDELQKILNQNKIIPLYSYTEAIKDTISLFQRRGISMGNVDVKRSVANSVDIHIEFSCTMSSYIRLMDLINNNDNIIVVEEADMESQNGYAQSWKLKLKRYFNL